MMFFLLYEMFEKRNVVCIRKLAADLLTKICFIEDLFREIFCKTGFGKIHPFDENIFIERLIEKLAIAFIDLGLKFFSKTDRFFIAGLCFFLFAGCKEKNYGQ